MATVALPTVQTKASSIEATGVLLAADEKAIITVADVDALVAAQKAYTAANQLKSKAEAERDNKKLQLFSRLIGVKTLDELKLLSPEQVNSKMLERAKAGLLGFAEKKAAAFLIKESHQKRPSWKDAFVEQNGELAAQAVEAATKECYSYTVEKP